MKAEFMKIVVVQVKGREWDDAVEMSVFYDPKARALFAVETGSLEMPTFVFSPYNGKELVIDD